MNIYIFIGGAYGDTRWVQQAKPTEEQLNSGDYEILKVDSDMRVFTPYGDSWKLVEPQDENQ